MPSVNKNAKGYNYKYADLPHLWESIEDVVSMADFTIVNTCDGQNVITTAVHEHGQIESKLPITGITDPQDLGAAITYFRRYNLLMIFNVMIEDNDAAKKPVVRVKDTIVTGVVPSKRFDPIEAEWKAKIEFCTDIDELKKVWETVPAIYKKILEGVKDAQKAVITK